MAFRLQLMPQAVRVLSACPAAVRERVLNELGAIFSGPLLGQEAQKSGTSVSSVCQLPSGFQVLYSVDWTHGLLHLLELQSPEEHVPTSTP